MLPHGRLLAVAIFVSFASNWQFAYQITYVNTASAVFRQIGDFAYSHSKGQHGARMPDDRWNTLWSIVVAGFYPGAIIGFIMVPYLVRRIGVKRALLYTCVPAIVGCLLQLFARLAARFDEFTFQQLLIFGRLLVGVQAGCSLCLLPMFVIEISPPIHVPFLSTLQQVCQSFSTVIGFLVGSPLLVSLGDFEFEWLQVIAVVPTILFFFFLLWLPHTPYCLLEDRQCTPQEASDSVLFYYGEEANPVTVREELHHRWCLEGEHIHDGTILGTVNLKGLVIGSVAAISFAFTADDLIDSFSSQILKKSSSSSDESIELRAQLTTVCLGVLLFVTSIFGSFLIDRFGRKKLLIMGLLGTAVSNTIVACSLANGSYVWATVGFCMTKCFIGFGAGAPAWFLTSELVAPKAVSVAQAISTGLLLVVTGLMTLVYLNVDALIPNYSILVLAAGPALICAIVLIFFLPETMDQTYEQIRDNLSLCFFSGLFSRRDHSFIEKKRLSDGYGSFNSSISDDSFGNGVLR
uniref:MFS domain-containing protein n=1 Tax=Steinernema glaseri TaxID=37863 RepID=A0A1I7Y7W0_9BILA